MKVILKQDIRGTGKKDQVLEVSDGYARNFLFPRKMAIEANAANVNSIKLQNEAEAHKKELAADKAREIAQNMKDMTVRLKAKAGKDGKMFGSITNKEIAQGLQQQHEIEVDRRKIILAEPIKSLGDFTVEVHMLSDAVGKIRVSVEAED